jgi:hypothetical protein
MLASSRNGPILNPREFASERIGFYLVWLEEVRIAALNPRDLAKAEQTKAECGLRNLNKRQTFSTNY